MLDLIDAVERLKKGIVEGGVSLGQVEQAVGKVASGIDVYLILAVSSYYIPLVLFFKAPEQRGVRTGATGTGKMRMRRRGVCGRDGSGEVLPCNHVSVPIPVVMSRLSA